MRQGIRGGPADDATLPASCDRYGSRHANCTLWNGSKTHARGHTVKRLRIGSALVVLGVLIECGIALVAPTTGPPAVVFVAGSVVAAVLITAVGAAMVLRPAVSTLPFRALVTPLVLGALVLTSAAGPSLLVAWLVAKPDVEARSSISDARADLVLATVRDHGIRRGLELLREAAAEDSLLEQRSHHVAHMAGRLAIEEADFDIGVLRDCPLGFASGCFHGVLERYFYARPDIPDDSVPNFCWRVTGESWLDARMLECSHGLGHGLAVRSDHHYEPAVGACDALSSKIERNECYDGVFMEVIARSMGGGHPGEHAAHSSGSPSDANSGRAEGAMHDLECDGVDARYRSSCWAYEYAAIRAGSGGSWDRTLEGCRAATSAEGVWACVFGMGKQLASSSRDRAAVIAATCEQLGGDEADACISGAVEALVDVDWAIAPAAGLCAATEASVAPACYRRLGRRLAFIERGDEALAVCDGFGAGSEPCRRGVARSREEQQSTSGDVTGT